MQAWGAGALAGVGIAGPAVIVIQILNETGSADASSPAAVAIVVAMAIALGVAGFVAATRALAAPLANGMTAALAAYGVVQVIAVVRLLILGDPVRWVAIPFFALLAAAIGVIGATIADLRSPDRTRDPERNS